MASAQTIHRARQNGISAGQYVGLGGRKINVDTVVDLLVDASQNGHIGVRRPANRMLEYMALGLWRILAPLHRGGRGDPRRGVDFNEHITVRVCRCGYHLTVTLDFHLRQITGDDHAEQIPPWLAPGAVV